MTVQTTCIWTGSKVRYIQEPLAQVWHSLPPPKPCSSTPLPLNFCGPPPLPSPFCHLSLISLFLSICLSLQSLIEEARKKAQKNLPTAFPFTLLGDLKESVLCVSNMVMCLLLSHSIGCGRVQPYCFLICKKGKGGKWRSMRLEGYTHYTTPPSKITFDIQL